MIDIESLDWQKNNGLLPVIVQNNETAQVLMLGYMNDEALRTTYETEKVTFFSRSRQSLWVKGETSGNFLEFISAEADCDLDTILVKANPSGPVCHTGKSTCFFQDKVPSVMFLQTLSALIKKRHQELPEGSYTTRLFSEGTARIAQKVGEESVEVVIAATKKDKAELLNESADLLYHLLVLLEDQDASLCEVAQILQSRHS